MNDLNSFEKEIKRVYRLPDGDPAFFDRLEVQLRTYPLHSERKTAPRLRRGWVYALAVLLLLCSIIAAIGPSKVLAQIQAIFGFVPNVGLVDTSSPFRQLAQPVSDTRDGVTLEIQSAFLSADQTLVTYTLSDLPTEIKRAQFGDPECMEAPYLTLPNGYSIEAREAGGSLTPEGSFVYFLRTDETVPADFNQATLTFPCLEGTARGKGPLNWSITLAFELAPEDIEVYPATLMVPLVGSASPLEITPEPSTQPVTAEPSMPATIVDGNRQGNMDLLSVVEEPDSYWVTWAYPNIEPGNHYIVPFDLVLYDANGVELPKPSQETRAELWNYENSLMNQLSDQDRMKYDAGTIRTLAVPKTGIAFPVYAKQNAYERLFPEKEAYVDVEFDSSQVLDSNDPVEIDQKIHVGSVEFKLDAIGKNPYGGYSFYFDGAQGKVVQCEVSLVGQPTDIHGSGSFYLDDPFHFYQAEIYRQIPTGMLTVRISKPAVLGDLVSFIGSWEPEK